MAACVSSLLGVDINDVPNVEVLFNIEPCTTMQDEPPLWGVVLDTFLNSKGYRWREASDEEIESSDLAFLCIGKSLDGSTNHAVIMQNGKVVHDPNPFRKGVSEILSLQVIEKI